MAKKTKTPSTRKLTPKAAPIPKAPRKAKAAAPDTARKGKAAAAPTEASPAAGNDTPRWRDLSTEQLRTMYREVVSRDTASTSRSYLIWKIREAKAGRVPVGPSKGRVHHGPTSAVTILIDEDVLKDLDKTAKQDGFTKRLPYMRDLMRRGLEVRGHAELAARFG